VFNHVVFFDITFVACAASQSEAPAGRHICSKCQTIIPPLFAKPRGARISFAASSAPRPSERMRPLAAAPVLHSLSDEGLAKVGHASPDLSGRAQLISVPCLQGLANPGKATQDPREVYFFRSLPEGRVPLRLKICVSFVSICGS